MKKVHSLAGLVAIAGLFVVQGSAATFNQNFAQDPLTAGWKVFGDTNLFHWNSTNQNLEVRWDSQRTNAYFYKSLGTIVARDDDFRIEFDLRLDDIGPSADTNKPYSFPIAIGLLNFAEATQTNFIRGTGYNSPDLAEFAYFFDDGSFYGTTTVWPVFVDSSSAFNYNSSSDSAIYPLVAGDWFRVDMAYAASNHTMTTTVTNLAHNSGITIIDPLSSSFTDFRVDTISISSYSDAGQTPAYAGSVFAHGVLDNIAVTVPAPPVQTVTGGFNNGVWQVQFNSRTNWTYTLERTTDFISWASAGAGVPGSGGTLTLSDLNPDSIGKVLYRVRANRP